MNNPYETPMSTLTEAPNENETLLASRWKRFLASIADAIIYFISSVPLYAYKQYVLNKEWSDYVSFEFMAGEIAYTFIMFSLINGYLLKTNGQTLGKYIFKIKIATIYYTKPTLFNALMVRTFLFWLISYHEWLVFLCLLDILFIYRKDMRCLHDHVARTTVINAAIPFNNG
jgi:uncharacterized RDD family membrane protein YckC